MGNPSMNNQNERQFAVRDCALAAIATGERAYNLRELGDKVLTIDPGSIYYHFWGGLLRPRFDDPEYHNDFAIWALYGLKDALLAERLGIIDPTEFGDLNLLREQVAEVIEARLDETQEVPSARRDNPFYFVRSQIVVFDTRCRIDRPEKLADTVPSMSVSSVFYHFIDARRRTPSREDDFRVWLRNCFEGYEDLSKTLSKVHPFFSGLTELRTRLTGVFRSYFGK
jgi:hypothetical protein